MPKLKNLICQIEWADTATPFQEYRTSYGDGVVETYIAVPSKPTPFTVHLTSRGFIHEGLAVVVYVDGHYQCNRNRVNLLPAKKGVPGERTEIDFVFRQKEKSIGDELFIGREWRFDDHNIVPTLPEGATDEHFEYLGSIEVVVLRCSATDSDETNLSTTSSGAASDVFEKDEGDQGLGKDDDEDRKNHDTKSTKPAKASTVGADEEILPFAGLFDGSSDYHRRPYPPPHEPFGRQDWHSQPPIHGRQSYGQPSSYGGPSHQYQKGSHGGFQAYPAPPRPPPADHREASDKKVHFDYGHDPGPAGDHNRYWDGDRNAGPHAPLNGFSTPGLSEWHSGPPGRYDDRFGYPPPRYGDFEHSSHGATTGHPSMPPQGSPYQQYPTHPQGPPQRFSDYTFGMPPWIASHSVPPWSQPMYGMPQSTYPYNPYPHASAYQPHSGSPRVPSMTGGGGTSPGNRDQTVTGFGSLDPARDEDNANDSGWGTKNDSATDQANSGGDQGGWDANESNNNNETGGDTSNWNNDDDNKGNGANDWNNDDGNKGNDISWGSTDDKDNNDNDAWANNDTNQGGSSGWDNSNQNNTSQGGWNGQNNATNTSGGGEDWAKSSGNAPAAVQSSGPGVRPLYGPHGAYYAVQSSNAPEATPDAEEEPRYDVPQSYVDITGSSKQVQPGRGYLYWKKRSQPDYIDKLGDPYARFVFLYRTKEELRKEVSLNVNEPSGNEEVQSFQNMSKDDLIQMLLRAKGALGGRIPSPPPQTTKPPEDASFRGVPVEPPTQPFLGYDIPERSGNPGGNGNGTSTAKSNNDKSNDWGASTGSNTQNNTNSNNNDWAASTGSNTNNASNDNTAWDAGGDSWGNNNAGDPNNEFPKQSWDAAREQQKSGPPPDPPQRNSGW